MKWANDLIELYDRNAHMAGVLVEDEPVLLPLYHTTVQAQITVDIDLDGNFIGANIAGEDSTTLIPITEKSGARTNGLDPHPFCDTIQYVAGDFNEYFHCKEAEKAQNKFREYINSLKEWAESSYSHEKVMILYTYLNKRVLVRDLCSSNILVLAEDGSVSPDARINGIKQTELFIRFRFIGSSPKECWTDRELQQKYVAYCSTKQVKSQISYLSGEMVQPTYLHPKKIRNEGDGTKLFSSNKDKDFTFIGVFGCKEEAYVIGLEESQKMHNALKWLIRRQGHNYDDMCIVMWTSDGQPYQDWTKGIEAPTGFTDTGKEEARLMQLAITGRNPDLQIFSTTTVMAFEPSSEKGRLAVTYYCETPTFLYNQNIEKWYQNSNWQYWKWDKENKEWISSIRTPGVKEITELLYGRPTDSAFLSMNGNESLYKMVAQKLLPCTLYGKPISADLVKLSFYRASQPLAFSNFRIWENVLALACSFVKYNRIIKSGKELSMALDLDSRDPNYLYGRLLAVADRIEYRTYDRGETRDTNAKRYMNSFYQRPFYTWRIIEAKLIPYLAKLSVPERLRYQNLLNEILDRFEGNDFQKNVRLNSQYLVGFHAQAMELRKKIEKNADELPADQNH